MKKSLLNITAGGFGAFLALIFAVFLMLPGSNYDGIEGRKTPGSDAFWDKMQNKVERERRAPQPRKRTDKDVAISAARQWVRHKTDGTVFPSALGATQRDGKWIVEVNMLNKGAQDYGITDAQKAIVTVEVSAGSAKVLDWSIH